MWICFYWAAKYTFNFFNFILLNILLIVRWNATWICSCQMRFIHSFLAHQTWSQSKSCCFTSSSAASRVWRLFSGSRYLRRRSRAAVLHRSWSPCTTIWSRSSTPPATTSGRACCEPVFLPAVHQTESSVWSQFVQRLSFEPPVARRLRLNASRVCNACCVGQVASIYATELAIFCTGQRLNVPLFWLKGDYPGGCIYCMRDFAGLPKPYCPSLV